MKYFKSRRARGLVAALMLALLVVPAFRPAYAQNVDILKIYQQVSNLHNADEVIKFFTDDAVFEVPGEVYQGKAAILAWAKADGVFDLDPTLKIVTPARVEGNKVIERQTSVPPPLQKAGQNISVEIDVIAEFQGDKIKKLSLVPTPAGLKTMEELQKQSGPPGAPNTGAGATATTAKTQQDNNWLMWALIASGTVVVITAGAALLLRRRTARR